MRKSVTFYKYHGTGNDFILIDARADGGSMYTQKTVKELCDRHFGIGADGLILLQSSESADFSMKYFNSDGNESTMCGNGGRCITAFARDLGIIKEKAVFTGIDGEHIACFSDTNFIHLKMIDVESIASLEGGYFLNTGSPHFVLPGNNIHDLDVFKEGKKIRDSAIFAPGGTNVNFMVVRGPAEIDVRTFERGVEQETLSCGTGSVASAITACYIQNTDNNSFQVNTSGGKLEVKFTREGNIRFTNIWLAGPVEFVFRGEVGIV